MVKEKTFIGDYVYIQMKGEDIVLTTEYGWEETPTNMIILTPELFEKLIELLK